MLCKIKLTDLDRRIETRPADFVKEINTVSAKKEDVKTNSDIIEEKSLPQASTSSDIQKVQILLRMYVNIKNTIISSVLRIRCGVK